MRTLLTIFAFTILLNVNAQDKKLQKQLQQYSPDQIAELETKKMELDFDLDENQRKEMYELNRELAQKRQQNLKDMKVRKAENKTLTSDEKYQKKWQQLDDQKKHQDHMKRILGENKYKIWKEYNKEKQLNRKKLMLKKNSEYSQKRTQHIQNLKKVS